MALQLEEEKQAQLVSQAPRRRLIPVTLGAASSVPTFLRGIRYVRIDAEGPGYQRGLKEILGILHGRAQVSESANYIIAPGEDLVGDVKMASNLLRGLLNSQFERIMADLDPEKFVRPLGSESDPMEDRARRVEELISLMCQRGGPWIVALQEALLAVRSPFSPFNGNTLENWVACPAENWRAANKQIIGVGSDRLTFSHPATPEDLQYASLLTWEGLAFRDASASVEIWVPLFERGGAGGMVFRCVKDRTALIVIIRQGQQERPLALEVWHREGGFLRLVESIPCSPGIVTKGLCRLTCRLNQHNAFISAASASQSGTSSVSVTVQVPSDHHTGHFGFVKFNSGAVAFTNPIITVIKRPHSFWVASGLTTKS